MYFFMVCFFIVLGGVRVSICYITIAFWCWHLQQGLKPKGSSYYDLSSINQTRVFNPDENRFTRYRPVRKKELKQTQYR